MWKDVAPDSFPSLTCINYLYLHFHPKYIIYLHLYRMRKCQIIILHSKTYIELVFILKSHHRWTLWKCSWRLLDWLSNFQTHHHNTHIFWMAQLGILFAPLFLPLLHLFFVTHCLFFACNWIHAGFLSVWLWILFCLAFFLVSFGFPHHRDFWLKLK